MKKRLFLLVAAPLLLLSACKQPESAAISEPEVVESGIVSGTVSYRERIALSPEA